MKALIITVGGSDEPLVSFIKQHKEDTGLIYFICSSGSGAASSSVTVDDKISGKSELKCPQCKTTVKKGFPTKESIIKQSGYEGEYKKIEIKKPDDFDEIYKKIYSVVAKAKQENYDEIIADFTGGTKAMSSALAVIASGDFGVKLSLTVGPRTDLVKTSSGSHPAILDIDRTRVDIVLKTVDMFISKKLYYSTRLILCDLLQKGLKQELINEISEKCSCVEAFAYWDSFEYEKSYEILKNYGRKFENELAYLLKILSKGKCTGYEKIFDLVTNAERQSNIGYYDNATARIYRAIELFAQTRLRNHYEIDTAHLEKSEKITQSKWEKYKNEKGEIKLGCIQAYELLSDLPDKIGEVYKQQKKQLLNILKIRNNSKLAHGNIPVTESQWKEMHKIIKEFIDKSCESIGITPEYVQLPNEF